jgi:preprotein translocase subunit SecF
VVFLSLWGFKLGIDFTSGSLLEVRFKGTLPTTDQLSATLKTTDLGDSFTLQPTENNGYIIRFQSIDEKVHQQVMDKIKADYEPKEKENNFVSQERYESIGPTIGSELRTKAFYAIILVNIFIVLYVAWSFRKVSYPVKSWRYGVAAVIALIHDITITMGVFAVLGHFAGVEINTAFIVALLTILGYSVNDTIVVFDRIRENLSKLPKMEFEVLVNRSVNETMARSINTSMTVMLVLLAVFIFGGASIHYFALALLVGVFCGTYSSIFIASTLLVIWEKWKHNRAQTS